MDSTLNESPNQTMSDIGEADARTSCFKTSVTILTWIELILGLSAISSAVFLNPRVPVLLYALYGVYFGIFIWFMYSTCRSTYLQQGPLNYVYGICAGCTLVTVAVILLTFFTSPNGVEIAFIAAVVFIICLILFPFISAIFYCFLRGNFIMPTYMKSKVSTPTSPQEGVDQPESKIAPQQSPV